jgi:hypothetical protein
LHAAAEWLRNTPLSQAVWSAIWFIRLVQAVHLLTAGVVCASGLMLALRVLGWRLADEPIAATWQRLAPWLGWGFAFMLASGVAQTLGDPVREFTATSYWVKLTLMAGSGAALSWLVRSTSGLAAKARASPVAHAVAIGLILSLFAIVMLGRTIAYDLQVWGGLSLRT